MSDQIMPCPFCAGKLKPLGYDTLVQTRFLCWGCSCTVHSLEDWERRASPWRSCKDDPPPDGKTVFLTQGDVLHAFTGYRFIGDGDDCYMDSLGVGPLDVVLWMPLPALPEETVMINEEISQFYQMRSTPINHQQLAARIAREIMTGGSRGDETAEKLALIDSHGHRFGSWSMASLTIFIMKLLCDSEIPNE